MIPRLPAFPPDEFKARLDRLREEMEQRSLEVIVVTDPANVFYLCGFDSENYFRPVRLVIPRDGEPRLVVFQAEVARAMNSTWYTDVDVYHQGESADDGVMTIVAQSGRVGTDRQDARDRYPSPAAIGLVESVRLVKRPSEIEQISKAAQLTDLGVMTAREAIANGVSDNEVAASIVHALYAAGSGTLPWGPIVAAGYRAGSPHSTFAGQRISGGDTTFLELTGIASRYASPLMRTVMTDPPTAEMRRFESAGQAALEAILSSVREGVPAATVADAGARQLAGLNDAMFHGVYGYPVGLAFPPTWIEELGFLITEDEPRPLLAGMVFHIPISLRKYGEFGVGQSYTIVVEENGCRVLSALPLGIMV